MASVTEPDQEKCNLILTASLYASSVEKKSWVQTPWVYALCFLLLLQFDLL